MKEIVKPDTDLAVNPFLSQSVTEDAQIYNIKHLGEIEEYTDLIVAFFLII